jgi:hypothetical protein
LQSRIVFLVMSAHQPAELITQLVGVLAPHPVVVHHDFSKCADFRLEVAGAHLVPDPRETGWGTWGFCEAILHGMRFCLEQFDFDYLQLLSPTCLPIRPIAEFQRHIESDGADAHADLLDLYSDTQAWATYATRAHLPAGSYRLRAAYRLARWYRASYADVEQRSSLQILTPKPGRAPIAGSVADRIMLAAVTMLARTGCTRAVYGPHWRPAVGSTWFGAKPEVCRYLIERAGDLRIREAFTRLSNVDEHFFPSLIHNSPFRVGPSNHMVSKFRNDGHPAEIDATALQMLCASGRFFARKFPQSVDAPIRRRVLSLVQASPPEVHGLASALHGLSFSRSG